MVRTAIGGRLWRSTLVAIIALAVPAAAAPVAAECDGPYPSFRAALPTAQRVVIGDVIAVRRGGGWNPAKGGGEASRFTLKVRYVPRGTAPAQVEITDLPTQPCGPAVVVHKGDRIALLFDGTDFTPPVTVNAVAWIRGTPVFDFDDQTITVAEVYRLLGLDPPDTSTAPSVLTDRTGGGFLPLIAALAAGLLVGWRRFVRDDRGRSA